MGDRRPPSGSSEADDGHKIIPGSRRPDGTMRKAIRVRAGYVPQDEVAKFETRASREQARRAQTSIPGLIPGMSAAAAPKAPLTKAARRNESRKQKRKEEKDKVEREDGKAGAVTEGLSKLKVAEEKEGQHAKEDKIAAGTKAEDPEKKLKSLKKKLKQIKELRDKVEKGEVVPDDDQKKKLAREIELKREIEELERSV